MSGAGMTLLDARFDVYLQPERPWFALYGQWLKPRRQVRLSPAWWPRAWQRDAAIAIDTTPGEAGAGHKRPELPR